jgi:NADPH:quinone reductase-like Zn-dependent oxidoreductase
VRNAVIGLNFVDIYYRRGTLPVPEFPAIIGDEASGVVEAVGPNVTLVKVGDRVAYADAFGAYTTVRLYPEDRLTLIPDGVTDDQAASSLLKGLTARYLLKETVQLHEGDTVLYHAAAGGVGQIFAQWARSLGIHVIGTVSTAEKAQIALQAAAQRRDRLRTTARSSRSAHGDTVLHLRPFFIPALIVLLHALQPGFHPAEVRGWAGSRRRTSPLRQSRQSRLGSLTLQPW